MACEGAERNCPEFNTDISFWRDVENEMEHIQFIGEKDTIEFHFDSLAINPEFLEFQVTGSEEGVTCETYKRYFYSVNSLDINFKEEYINYEDAFQNRSYLSFYFKPYNIDTTYRIKELALLKYYNNLGGTELIDEYSFKGIQYQNAEEAIVTHNLNIPLNQMVEPQYFSKLVFKRGIGLIGFETIEKGKYIRVK